MVCVVCLESLPEQCLGTQYIVLYNMDIVWEPIDENNRPNFNPLRVYHKERKKKKIIMYTLKPKLKKKP